MKLNNNIVSKFNPLPHVEHRSWEADSFSTGQENMCIIYIFVTQFTLSYPELGESKPHCYPVS
jgi:hypothetical protein